MIAMRVLIGAERTGDVDTSALAKQIAVSKMRGFIGKPFVAEKAHKMKINLSLVQFQPTGLSFERILTALE